jgi:hypothetical protein
MFIINVLNILMNAAGLADVAHFRGATKMGDIGYSLPRRDLIAPTAQPADPFSFPVADTSDNPRAAAGRFPVYAL